MKKLPYCLALSCLLSMTNLTQAAAPISTLAGDGAASLRGDGSAASRASLHFPSMAIKDSNGNIYIADTDNHVIRHIDASTGIISTLADSTVGLNRPSGLALDSTGNLYISDTGNNLIRRIDSTGSISTFAGAGTTKLNAPRGLVFDSNDNLYVADSGSGVILKITSTGTITTFAGNGSQGFNGNGLPALNTSFNAPYYLAINNSNALYVSGYFSQRIRKIDLNPANPTHPVTTVAGDGQAGFSGDNVAAISSSLNSPQGLAVDHKGNLYIADHLNHRVRVVDNSGQINTVAGIGTANFSGDNGAAALAEINHPVGLFFDNSSDQLLLADSFNHRIRAIVIDLTPPVLTLLGSTPITVEASLNYLDAGATAIDVVDGDISSQIVVVNPVQSTVPSTYTLSYNVSDAAGNAAPQITRDVTIIDTTAPDLILNGSNPMPLEAGTAYSEPGATALDIVDGDLTNSITTTGAATVDGNVIGTYTVDYSVTDAAGNTNTTTRTINVADTLPPVITLKGAASMTLDMNSKYVDQGATALDSFEGDLSTGIIQSGSVNTAQPGNYKITYRSIDSSGNPNTKVRNITVIDHLILRSTTRGSSSGGGSLGLNLLLSGLGLTLLRRRKQSLTAKKQEVAQ